MINAKDHEDYKVIVKPKTNKLNTGMIEDKLISANEQDMLDSQIDIYYNSLQFIDFKKSGLDVMSQKCKKCELDTIYDIYIYANTLMVIRSHTVMTVCA